MATPLIFIKEMKVETVIGVSDWERALPQTLIIDLEMALNSHQSLTSDLIKDTIDYAVVADRIRSITSNHTFKLLEPLAHLILETLEKEFHTPWMKLTISKPYILQEVKTVGVVFEKGMRT
ncbi:MAG: dihydroneopterin aldolase [Candidatus Methylopumilus sp.]|nr:dihydroneopterin aldolase [Candidatus Methylopumilus sp.]